MIKSNLITGGVYSTEWDKRPVRVLAYDSFELFYDGWWEHENDWGLKCHNSKVSFYRTSTPDFETSASLIRGDPLSEEEQQKYKLDLPFRLCRHKELTWVQKSFSNLESFVSYCKEQNVELVDEPILKARQIILIPLGPNLGRKKSNLIQADNNKCFTEAELLWKAHNIQAPFETGITFGIGLYRSGLEKRHPSYYIGGYYDLAEFVKEKHT